jgi:hypothetical protein
VIQVVMIGIVIAFPQMVMHYKAPAVDPASIEIKMPTLTPLAPGGAAPALPGVPALGAPNFGAPAEAHGCRPAAPGSPLGGPKLGAPAVNP